MWDKNGEPLVSAVLVAYNREKYVGATIRSVFNQTYKNVELIVVDDGSVDNTVKVIKETLNEISGKYEVITIKQNLGCAYVRNLGNRIAEGKYIAVVDSDDINLPQRFEREVVFLETHPEIYMVGGGAIVIDKDGKIGREPFMYLCPQIHRDIAKNIIAGPKRTLLHPTIMHRKDDFFRVGGYSEDLPITHDYELYIKLLRIGKKMYNIQWPLIKYRKHTDTLSQIFSNTEKATEELKKIRTRIWQKENE